MSIEVRNLSKQFGTFSALRDVSLEVHRGEVVGAGIRDDAARVASMSDTRMKYGGVKRH